jgi:transcriptional regulator GlxA family with amidase domain
MRPHVVAVLALPEVIGFDLQIPPQVFGTAEADGQPLYDVRVCGFAEGVPTTAGFSLLLEHGPETLAVADTVVVPGTRFAPARREGVLPAEVAAALDTVPAHARWLSICTGAFVLAAAGRLAGRRVTTHWAHADELRRLHPDLEVDESVLFVDDGDVATSAGLAAGLDLCLHVLRGDHGAEVANAVARHLVVAPWRDGGQAQFIDRPVPDADDDRVGAAMAWALEHLHERITLEQLAARAFMSVRTFTRQFRRTVGQTPMAWLVEQRVRASMTLLETTEQPVEWVGAQSGFPAPASYRRHFRRVVGVSPSQYRRTFAAA